jgi:hypothetical protein
MLVLLLHVVVLLRAAWWCGWRRVFEGNGDGWTGDFVLVVIVLNFVLTCSVGVVLG